MVTFSISLYPSLSIYIEYIYYVLNLYIIIYIIIYLYDSYIYTVLYYPHSNKFEKYFSWPKTRRRSRRKWRPYGIIWARTNLKIKNRQRTQNSLSKCCLGRVLDVSCTSPTLSPETFTWRPHTQDERLPTRPRRSQLWRINSYRCDGYNIYLTV